MAREFPCFGVFPGDVDGVVKVQQQTLAAIEEAEAEKIVVDEGEEGTENDIDETEADGAFGHDHLRA